MTPRPYRMQQRRAGVDATRVRIIVAAREVLVSGGRFSIEAVAREAGVARLTVYDRFESRDGLVEAVLDALAASGGLTDLPDAFSRSDPIEALDRFIAIFCGFYSEHRPLLRRLDALAALRAGTPAYRDRHPRRLDGLGVLLARVAAAGHPDAGSDDVLRATHALTGFAFVDEFAGPDDPTAVAPRIAGLVKEIAHLR